MALARMRNGTRPFPVSQPANVGDQPAAAPATGRVLAVAVLAVAAVPAVITALVICLALGRPLLFRQERCGLGGRVFRIAKFRTMHDLRDPEGRPLPDAMRQTAATKLLRRLRFDEIPQILAVIRGEMAFVGPRPLPPEIVTGFGGAGLVRGAVRPGLTGWAQVNGNTKLTDAEKLALDVWYIDHRSAALDLAILARTVATIVCGERVDREAVRRAEAHLAARLSGEAR